MAARCHAAPFHVHVSPSEPWICAAGLGCTACCAPPHAERSKTIAKNAARRMLWEELKAGQTLRLRAFGPTHCRRRLPYVLLDPNAVAVRVVPFEFDASSR